MESFFLSQLRGLTEGRRPQPAAHRSDKKTLTNTFLHVSCFRLFGKENHTHSELLRMYSYLCVTNCEEDVTSLKKNANNRDVNSDQRN